MWHRSGRPRLFIRSYFCSDIRRAKREATHLTLLDYLPPTPPTGILFHLYIKGRAGAGKMKKITKKRIK